MRALYEPTAHTPSGAKTDDLASLLSAARAKRVIELWPDCFEAFDFFCDIRTQWRSGPGGPTGLDYSVVYRELDERGYQGEAREQMKRDLRAMERAALTAIYEK